MPELFYDDAAAKFRVLRDNLSLNPNNTESIRLFREECCRLLQTIAKTPSASQDRNLCRLGMEIAAETAQTRVCEKREDGCLITRPDPCPEKLRALCVQIYDTLSASCRGDRMYIPPRIERTGPDTERSLSALRRHDLQNAQKNAERQASNKNINRLFGRRK